MGVRAAAQVGCGAICQGWEEQEGGVEDSGGDKPGQWAAGIEEVPLSIRGHSKGRARSHSGAAGQLGIKRPP